MTAPYVICSFYRAGSTHNLFVDAARALQEMGARFEDWSAVSDELGETGRQGGRLDERIDWSRSLAPSVAIEAPVTVPVDKLGSTEALLGHADYSGLPATKRVLTLAFSGPEFAHLADGKDALKKGRAISLLFLKLCERLHPLYASLTVDYELESPEQLIQDSRSYAFRDFYIDGSSFTPAAMTAIKEIVSDFYVAFAGRGVYFSGTRFFNPEGVDLGAAGSTLSGKIATLLATELRRSQTKGWPESGSTNPER